MVLCKLACRQQQTSVNSCAAIDKWLSMQWQIQEVAKVSAETPPKNNACSPNLITIYVDDKITRVIHTVSSVLCWDFLYWPNFSYLCLLKSLKTPLQR